MADNSNTLLDSKRAIPNKLLNEDGSTTDLLGNSVTSTSDAWRLAKALPNKVLNSDGTYSTLSEIIGGGASGDLFIVVEELPQEGEPNKIYLVPKDDGSGGFDEYNYIDGSWNLLGDVDIDLSDYYTKNETNTNFLKKDNTTAYTPTADYHPSTKKYVDDMVGDIETILTTLDVGGGVDVNS